MEVIDIQAVKDCLEEVSDCEDKQYALALLEWAIGKRTFDLAEHDKQIRKDAIDEVGKAISDYLFDFPMMNPIMTRNEILLFLEQLKEQKQ